ncbi:BMP-binding endothelial regulator protein-like isoform X2 [Ptychodera flava]|uniref:BMP-binding endothelial regulator protein-like isoform X2 n=1 Tax=Ptychodera flava TaxID=63121 RepID=UPI003969D5D1
MKCLTLFFVLLCVIDQSPAKVTRSFVLLYKGSDNRKETEDELRALQNHLREVASFPVLKNKAELQSNIEKADKRIEVLLNSRVSDRKFKINIRPIQHFIARRVLMWLRFGGLKGDPHFTTFDGHRYDFQGLCWYTLVKDCSSVPDFDVKGRFEERYIDPEVKTRTVEVMITVGTETINLKEDDSIYIVPIWKAINLVMGGLQWLQPKRVNGKPLISNDQLKNMKLIKEDDEIIVTLPGLQATWSGPNHAMSATITEPLKKGLVCGLLGNADGDPDNDFKKFDGYRTDNVDDFANSWKVSSMTC